MGDTCNNKRKCTSPSQEQVHDCCGSCGQSNGDYILLQEDIRTLKEENEKLRDTLKQTQSALEMYQKTFELMSEGGYIVRGSNGNIMATNTWFDQMLGYNKGELLYRYVGDINDHHDKTRASSIMTSLNETGSYEGHIPTRRKDGSVFWSLLKAKAFVHSEYGKMYICVRTDLSSIQKIEKQVEEAAFSAKKKLDWVNMIAHEIRTPIHQVIGLVDLLSATQLSAEQASMAHTVKECCHHLSGILNDVLDSARLGADKVQLERHHFNLWKCVYDVVLAAKTSTAKALDFPVHIAPDVPEFVLGDQMRIRQILVNLTSNAEKFTEKGFISVSVSVTESFADPETNKPMAVVLFQVKDTGIGIPPSKAGMIFDMFSQADSSTTRKFGGFGMGLNIASKLVQLMNGDMGVISENIVGKGSTFYFTLQLEVSTADGGNDLAPSQSLEANMLIEKPVENVTAKSLRILIVEDNLLNQKVLKMMLIKLGHIVTLVNSGADALALLGKGTTFDLLLMDIMMPVMDGLQTTREMQKILPVEKRPTVVAITASVTEDLKAQCADAGMSDFIAKPATFKKVTALITKWANALTTAPA